MASEKDELDDLINNSLFKIKPIYIELPNYSYYHSAITGQKDDCNNRFIGRGELIKKLGHLFLNQQKIQALI